jgi:CRISPR-associated protein Cas2
MSDRRFVLVVYDISNDKRRTKLHNTLLDFGTPVQYSVFECLLDREAATRMHRAVMKVIHPRVDRVRFYPLCARCVARVEVTSGVEVLSEDADTIVV